MFDDCWRLINGRLADGFGTMLFALGNTALRLAMALFYVALTAMLWCYLRLSAEALRRPLPRLSWGAGSGAAWICWSLAAIWLFTLIGLSTEEYDVAMLMQSPQMAAYFEQATQKSEQAEGDLQWTFFADNYRE